MCRVGYTVALASERSLSQLYAAKRVASICLVLMCVLLVHIQIEDGMGCLQTICHVLLRCFLSLVFAPLLNRRS